MLGSCTLHVIRMHVHLAYIVIALVYLYYDICMRTTKKHQAHRFGQRDQNTATGTSVKSEKKIVLRTTTTAAAAVPNKLWLAATTRMIQQDSAVTCSVKH